jgi:hypothetical protein
MNPTVVQVFDLCRHAPGALRYDVKITLLAAGLIFLLALVLGVWLGSVGWPQKRKKSPNGVIAVS